MKATSGRYFEGTLCSLLESTWHFVCPIMNFWMALWSAVSWGLKVGPTQRLTKTEDIFPPVPPVLFCFFTFSHLTFCICWLLLALFFYHFLLCFAFNSSPTTFSLLHHWLLIGQLLYFYFSLLQVHSDCLAELGLTLNTVLYGTWCACVSYSYLMFL